MHPLAGSWIANVARSQRHANHQFASASMQFEITPVQVKLSYEGVNASGKREHSAQVIHADGLEHAHPQAPGITIVSTLGPRGLQSTARKGDAVIGGGSYDVSEDGAVMTATVRGVDANGQAFDQVIVFDRGE